MRCPNCNSPMFVADENATSKSLVKFFRCTNCVGEHVSSEPIAESNRTLNTKAERTEFYGFKPVGAPNSFQMF